MVSSRLASARTPHGKFGINGDQRIPATRPVPDAPELPLPKTESFGGAWRANPYKVDQSPFYSHVSQSMGTSSTITIAGQIGRDLNGNIPSDPVEQIELAFTNLERCLETAGAGVEDVLQLRYYIVEYDHENLRHRGPLFKFLGWHRPSTTLVPVTKLAVPGLIFEVEATAAIPQHQTERVDVVVVGAGLSGLQTAVDLHKAGLTVKVLEARNRVGGKTLSRHSHSKSGAFSVCDMGAAWINDTNQSRMYALARKYKLELITQNTEGKIVVDDGIGRLKTHPYGQLLAGDGDKEEIADVIRIREIFENTCQQIDINSTVASGKKLRKDLDEVTFEEWIKSYGPFKEDALNALKVGTRAMLGVEPSEMSALYFLDYCKSGGGYMLMRSDTKHGGQYLRIARGTQSFSGGLASELPEDTIILRSPVRKIEQLAGGVSVTSARGIFEASRVVVSVPTSLYKEIMFEPRIPEKDILADSTRLGDYCKSIVIYSKPWWKEQGFCGMSQSSHGPFSVTRDTSGEFGYSLTCFVVGLPAREWMKRSRKERDTAVLDQIQKLFGPFAKVDEPDHIEEQIWQNEQWSQGCPCPVMGPGGLTRLEHVLRAPSGRVHFVGTETAYKWKGYMEGAVRSGERGAQEVLVAMNRAKV